MKKHPFLIGFVIVSLAAMAFFAVVVGVFAIVERNDELSSVSSLWKDSVGVIEVNGVIESSDTVVEQIRKFAEDDKIRALLVRIDSPGGAVAPTQEIYSELRKVSQAGKPVVASMASAAASGGYYIAAACDTIVANPGTLTGSIGVVMEFFSAEGAFDKLGLKSEVVKAGKYKDAGNLARSLTPDERRMLQATIDDVHGQFIAAVAEGRKLPIEQIEAIADGRVFSGQQAQAVGLVDQLGTFYDAVDILKEKLQVKGKLNLVYPRKPQPSFTDFLLDGMFKRLPGLLGASGQKTPTTQGFSIR